MERLLHLCSRELAILELLLVVLIHMVSLCSRALGSFCPIERAGQAGKQHPAAAWAVFDSKENTLGN